MSCHVFPLPARKARKMPNHAFMGSKIEHKKEKNLVQPKQIPGLRKKPKIFPGFPGFLSRIGPKISGGTYVADMESFPDSFLFSFCDGNN